MKIILFLENKIMEFKLPKEISGSFSFDENPEEESKLINIESRDGIWNIYSTSDSIVWDNNRQILQQQLEENKFYTIKRENNSYLIYITASRENNILPYYYDKNINIIFGNDNSCNIRYNCNYIEGPIFNIKYEETSLTLNILKPSKLYVNNYAITSNKIKLNIGDKISIYKINIIFLYGILLINNPEDEIFITEVNANIRYCELPKNAEQENKELKELELYQENSYFSKSPRLRRFVEQKEITLDPPPQTENKNETPLLIVIGPMLTMGITSLVTLTSTVMRINQNETTIEASWPQLVTGSAMLLSTLLWPLITNFYNKYAKAKRKQEIIEKYSKYLVKKEKELIAEAKLQHDILLENLITLEECVKNITTRGILFWNKRSDENDFLTVRIGTGNEKLAVEVKYPEEGFTIEEDELRKKADALVSKYEYIQNVPIGYSLYENKVTAIMGNGNQSYDFVNNIILQLITFYSYEDLKIIVFTNEENKIKWDYIKYLNHCFTNNKELRFFASDPESIKTIGELLNIEVNNRMNALSSNSKVSELKPYYLIIVDNYEEIKKYDFIKTITEEEENIGFSVLIVENRLSKLPSKCNNFISLSGTTAGVLKNSYEKQEQILFKEEINNDINMMDVARVLSNIPIEFEEGIKQLPDTITFLEMERIGKVEQLNILNRWNMNDPTVSLKAEVGVDELGNLMFLDLHEKYHGPHGLIAGTTGSGKSEFIITYILSMAINYSPDYVSFILIDYKGGGLAGAFENKVTGVYLPHLAGTITNLDKAEMDRTLVSIDSEVKRRQAMFNEARDKLGESTIDIYKYQRFYREKKLTEPIPHLFIICDEFAELKAQQPDFMDNLISVARIGRSLGVHLILATQKPSGVVNDQIWSNTKFRVCLKVQDEADSKEMLKRPEAAYIKQTGRFYLQVGMDELFALGQSGWCGAKYYPSNKIVKQIDKSINFIDDCGRFIKSIQASGGTKIEAQGEQLGAIMKNIIEVAGKVNKKSKRLWLDNIPPIILVDNIIKKYNIKNIPNNITAIIGEYDAPEKQEQGLLEYSFLNDGNTIIYGIDSTEKEMLLNSIIYSTIIRYTSEEINYYIIDYGSESLRKFNNFSQIGGMVFAGEDEKFKNLIKLIKTELKERKKLFSDYGGEYINYIKNSNNKIPLKVIILNNYDSIYENNQDLYEYFPDLVRDSERYGIIFILTANAINSVGNKISQNFENVYAYKMKDSAEYQSLFNSRKKIEPRDVVGRGLVDNDGIHEFQTCSIIEKSEELNEYLMKLSSNQQQKNMIIAEKIPTLPNIVTYDLVENKITDITKVPIGISKSELEVSYYDFTISPGIVITSNKIININSFIQSLGYIFTKLPNTDTFFIDGMNKFQSIKSIIKNYYNENLDKILESLTKYLEEFNNKNIKRNQIIMIYGIDKFIGKLSNSNEMQEFMKKIKQNEMFRVIIMDDAVKIKNYAFETWYNSNFSNSDGIWIGKGLADQNVFKLGNIKKEYMKEIKNDFGYNITEFSAELIKLIDFYNKGDGENNEE